MNQPDEPQGFQRIWIDESGWVEQYCVCGSSSGHETSIPKADKWLRDHVNRMFEAKHPGETFGAFQKPTKKA